MTTTYYTAPLKNKAVASESVTKIINYVDNEQIDALKKDLNELSKKIPIQRRYSDNINELRDKLNEGVEKSQLERLEKEILELKEQIKQSARECEHECDTYDDTKLYEEIESKYNSLKIDIDAVKKEFEENNYKSSQSPMRDKKDDLKMRLEISTLSNQLKDLEGRINTNHSILMNNLEVYNEEVINLKTALSVVDKEIIKVNFALKSCVRKDDENVILEMINKLRDDINKINELPENPPPVKNTVQKTPAFKASAFKPAPKQRMTTPIVSVKRTINP